MDDGEGKKIFRLAPVMRDFLRTCVPLDWARSVTTDQLRLVTGEAAGQRSRQTGRVTRRFSDVVWEVRDLPERPRDSVLVVLLELQDRSDPVMPLRMLEYVTLHLWERHRAGEPAPAILPVVLHTGYSAWTAPESLQSEWPASILPERLAPRLGYHLVSIGAWPLPDAFADRNLVTEIFRWMRHDGTTDVTRLVDDIMMVAERQDERWVLDALADPLGRIFARRHNRDLPPDPVRTMQSLEDEMKTWLFMPGEGEWKQMLDDERRLRRQEQKLRRQAQEDLRRQAQELRRQEQERHRQEQELRRQEQERHRRAQEQVLRRAILRLDPTATEDALTPLDVDELQAWFDRL